jgi:hypothetical protein
LYWEGKPPGEPKHRKPVAAGFSLRSSPPWQLSGAHLGRQRSEPTSDRACEPGQTQVNYFPMSVAELAKELAALPLAKRAEVLRAACHDLDQPSRQAVERMLRRLENQDVPEDFWEGLEEAEDGKATDVRDEHFKRPPA